MPLSNILAQEARHGLDQPDRGCQAILAGTEVVALRIWGKILGGTAGFAIGGPIGALIGAAAGHAYDFTVRRKRRRPPDQAKIGIKPVTIPGSARCSAIRTRPAGSRSPPR